jgi:ATP-dependent Clp protease ATP-binding subunit ClpA
MFENMKQKLRDMVTIKALCEEAERHARQNGESEPGAEHFLLSAIDLPEGSARRAFMRLGVSPDNVRTAIIAQYNEALQRVGVDSAALSEAIEEVPLTGEVSKLYRVKASGSAVLQSLAALRCDGNREPLVGAHVIAVIANMTEGVAARTLRAMDIDQSALAASAATEARGPSS